MPEESRLQYIKLGLDKRSLATTYFRLDKIPLLLCCLRVRGSSHSHVNDQCRFGPTEACQESYSLGL